MQSRALSVDTKNREKETPDADFIQLLAKIMKLGHTMTWMTIFNL